MVLFKIIFIFYFLNYISKIKKVYPILWIYNFYKLICLESIFICINTGYKYIEDAIKSVSKFKEAIKYLEEAKSGRCITIADIPDLIPRPLDVEEFKAATNNK